MVQQEGGGGGRSSKKVEGLIVGGLLVAQCILAGYVVFVDHVLDLGANPLALIVLSTVASSLFFLPFAITLESKKWPSKISSTLMAQFELIALGGDGAHLLWALRSLVGEEQLRSLSYPN